MDTIRCLDLPVTLSVGVVTYMVEKQTTVDELVSLADKAMYTIKNSTKNAVQYIVAS